MRGLAVCFLCCVWRSFDLAVSLGRPLQHQIFGISTNSDQRIIPDALEERIPFPPERIQRDESAAFAARSQRRDLFCEQPLTVLTIQVGRPAAQPGLFQQVSKAFPDLTYYDADLPLSLHQRQLRRLLQHQHQLRVAPRRPLRALHPHLPQHPSHHHKQHPLRSSMRKPRASQF